MEYLVGDKVSIVNWLVREPGEIIKTDQVDQVARIKFFNSTKDGWYDYEDIRFVSVKDHYIRSFSYK